MPFPLTPGDTSGVIRLQINGAIHDLDLRDLEIMDGPGERQRACALMAFWGGVAAEAEAAITTAEAVYRHWSATRLAAIHSGGEKVPEWRAKIMVEVDVGFLNCKQIIAETVEVAGKAKSIYEAFKQKAYTLGALVSAETAQWRHAGAMTAVDTERVPSWGGLREDSTAQPKTEVPTTSAHAPSRASAAVVDQKKQTVKQALAITRSHAKGS